MEVQTALVVFVFILKTWLHLQACFFWAKLESYLCDQFRRMCGDGDDKSLVSLLFAFQAPLGAVEPTQANTNDTSGPSSDAGQP